MHTGRFVWHDMWTPDAAASAAFYGGLLGWTTRDAGYSDRRYTVVMVDGVGIGGMITLDSASGPPPCWVGYIGVANVDDAAAGVLRLGGAIHHAAEDIPGIGRFAVGADPQGAVFTLFDRANAPAPTTGIGPGRVGWNELYADRWEAVWPFYAELFGWTRMDAIDMGEMGTYQTFGAGEGSIGGMMDRHGMRPAWQFYFVVASSAQAAAGLVAELGGRVLRGPMRVPGGQWALHCLDPHGAAFGLLAPSEA